MVAGPGRAGLVVGRAEERTQRGIVATAFESRDFFLARGLDENGVLTS